MSLVIRMPAMSAVLSVMTVTPVPMMVTVMVPLMTVPVPMMLIVYRNKVWVQQPRAVIRIIVVVLRVMRIGGNFRRTNLPARPLRVVCILVLE